MKIKPKNWEAHQHYKTRNPPWIKLHKRLLDDFDFQSLPIASKALAPMLWLLASETKDGVFDADPKLVAFRLRWTEKDLGAALTPLIESGFFMRLQDDSVMLATHKQLRTTETETETETTLSAKRTEPPSGFMSFWQAYPSRRRSGRGACVRVWVREKLEGVADQIVLHVEAMKLTPEWTREDGRFIPLSLTYLNQRRFEDGMPEAPRPRLVI